MKTSQSLLDYLASCSESSLHAFELARLNDVANLHQQLVQQISATVGKIVEAEIQAGIANWIGNSRRYTRRASDQLSGRSREIREAQYSLPILASVRSGPRELPRHHADTAPRVQKLSDTSKSFASPRQLKLVPAL